MDEETFSEWANSLLNTAQQICNDSQGEHIKLRDG